MTIKIQHCCKCDQPTGRCNEDSLYIYDIGPLCEGCFDIIYENITTKDKYYCKEHRMHYEKTSGQGNWHKWACPKCQNNSN